MSRGGWIILIGGVILLVGIALFSFGTASFLPTLESTTLAPSDFLNHTVDIGEAGSALVYLIQIEQFASGDELTVFIRTPSVEEVDRTTVNNSVLFTSPPFLTTEPGPHMVVIQNTAGQSVSLSSAAVEITLLTLTLLSAGFFLGFAGGIVFIVGLVLWLIDRGRRRRQPLEMPPPPP